MGEAKKFKLHLLKFYVKNYLKKLKKNNGAKICDGDRARARQGIPRHQAQGTRQAFQEKGSPAQTRQIRPRDGPRNRRFRPVREALFGVAEGVERQAMLEVCQKASRRSHPRKEKARGDASRPPSPEKGRQRQAINYISFSVEIKDCHLKKCYHFSFSC